MKNYYVALSTLDEFTQGEEGVYEKELIYAGEFIHPEQDLKFSVDEASIDHWVDVQSKLLADGIKVPLPNGHTTDAMSRLGEVIDFYKKEDSKGRVALFGKVKFDSEDIASTAKNSQCSVFIEPSTMSTTSGAIYQKPITHVALTDYPVVQDMDAFKAIAASKDASVYIDEIKKPVGFNLNALAQMLGLQPNMDQNTLLQQIMQAVQGLLGKQQQPAPPQPPVQPQPKPQIKGNPMSNPLVASLLRDNRSSRIKALVEKGAIIPADVKTLEEKYFSEDVTLALSKSDSIDDGFDDVINCIENAHKATSDLFNEKSGGQVISLSKGDILDPKKNPLLNACSKVGSA